MKNHHRLRILIGLVTGLALSVSPLSLKAFELSGYLSSDEFEQAIQAMNGYECVKVSSLGTTAEGRDVHLLTVGTGDVATKPAALLMGSVDASNLVGSELALRIAEQLGAGHQGGDEYITRLLAEVTLYVIPRPSPDATAQLLEKPIDDRATNTRPTDADRDGQVDEDPHEDLDGNGVITNLRVADPTGPWMQHPDDSRILIRAEREQDEKGQYRLYSEGVDNDQDEQWNEDGPGGVAFNRNFPFEYPFFAGDAGPHQVSEPESRAVADWMFTRPNIFLVFSFAPQDNLTKPWPVAKENGSRIKQQVLKDDEPCYRLFAQKYEEQVGKENAPTAAEHAGAFAPWAYFHYGRWSIASRGWWIPNVEVPSQDNSDDKGNKTTEADGTTKVAASSADSVDEDRGQADEADVSSSSDKSAKNKDDRNRAELNALAWLEREGIDGFVDWREIDHPDFPDKKVEVGGFKPLLRDHPPVEQLDELATTHRKFLTDAIDLRARLEFEPPEVEPLGAGIYRLTVAVLNRGFLPTASAMGNTTGRLQRLDLEIILPKGASLLTGHARESLGVLAGNGGRVQQTWLVRLANPQEPVNIKLRAGEPSIGTIEQDVVLETSTTPEPETQDDE